MQDDAAPGLIDQAFDRTGGAEAESRQGQA